MYFRLVTPPALVSGPIIMLLKAFFQTDVLELLSGGWTVHPSAADYVWKRRDHVAGVLDALTIDENEKARVRSLVETTPEPLDQILTKLGLVTESALYAAYSRVFGMERWSSSSGWQIDPQQLSGINPHFLQKRRIAPVAITDEEVHAICVDPLDKAAQRALSIVYGRPVVFFLATPSEWEAISAELEGAPVDTGERPALDLTSDVARLKDLASEEPVIRRVNRLIITAIKARASDIHIEPCPRSAAVKFRVDGVLQPVEELPLEMAVAVVSRIKILCGLDIAERRLPQDGRFSFPVEGRELDIRVSTVPADYGESLVLRLLDKGGLTLSFSHLGFTDTHTAAIMRCVTQPNGIFLVTGPTGSGKTTTLYTVLEHLKQQGKKILTIEDPIEYRLSGISQSQIKPDIGYSFATALRSFLRHDPDVIMVGEIRDLETAEIAIQAALTGHLVLSTLHTNDAPSAIIRLLDMGVDDFLLSATLTGVLGQRLVRSLQSGEADSTYSGRTVVAEMLEITSELKPLVKGGVRLHELITHAEAQGYRSLHSDGRDKVQAGITSASELTRVIGEPR